MAVAYTETGFPLYHSTVAGEKGASKTYMSPEMKGEQWYALQVRSRWEGSTATLLTGKGYETLLPIYKLKRRWSGRLKEVNAPLFPGYVFCSFDVLKRLPILVTPGVIAVVGRGRVPVPMEASEISAVQALVSSGLPAEPYPYLEVGQKVRIESDALRGVEGILLAFKGSQRIVVSVSLLRRSVALEIDRARVIPIRGTSGLNPLTSQSLLVGAMS
jgi:transcriptional antiterminator NusG